VYASTSFSFASIHIDGVTRDYEVVIDGGEIRKRKKKPSKQFRHDLSRANFAVSKLIVHPVPLPVAPAREPRSPVVLMAAMRA
jgi:hypothetical protein